MRSSLLFGRLARGVALVLLAQTSLGAEHPAERADVSVIFADPTIRDLSRAACEGNAPAVRSAVQAGADPNAVGRDGITPLAWAVRCESVAGVKALLAAGANPDQVIGDRFTSVVYLAASGDDPGPLEVLLGAGASAESYSLKSDRTAMTQALLHGITSGDWRAWNLLLPKVDINRPYDKFGETIALRAAYFNQFELVVQLLERGYDYRILELAKVVADAGNLTEHAASWQRKAIQMLERRGVVFPVAPSRLQLITEGELQLLPPNRR